MKLVLSHYVSRLLSVCLFKFYFYMLYFCIRPLKSAANLYLGILLITQKRDYIKKTGPEVFQKSTSGRNAESLSFFHLKILASQSHELSFAQISKQNYFRNVKMFVFFLLWSCFLGRSTLRSGLFLWLFYLQQNICKCNKSI